MPFSSWLSCRLFLVAASLSASIATAADRTVAVALSSGSAPGIAGHGFSSFGRPSINASGQVAFVGSTRSISEPTTYGSGVWVGTPGDLGAVAVTGELKPDATEIFTVVQTNSSRLISLNDAGEVVFLAETATVNGPPTTTQGVWKGDRDSATRLYFDGQTAPEVSDNFSFTNLSNSTAAINDRGDVLFATWLYSSTLGMRRSLWLTPDGASRQIIAAEEPIGGRLGQAPIARYYATSLNIGPAGEVTFAGWGPGNSYTTLPLGVAALAGDELSVLAMTGLAAPGLPGLTVNSLSLHDSAGGAAVSVHAQLSDGRTGVWALGPEGIEPRLIVGDPVPGGAVGEVIDTFYYQSVVNARGAIAVYGGTKDGSGVRKTGIWLADDSGYRLVAKQGDAAPGSDALFNGFIRSEPVLNSRGQIAFLGSVGTSPMFTGIWATNPQGELVKIVKVGDQVEVTPGDLRTVQSVQLAVGSGGEDGRASSFNDIGQLAYTATFTDSTSAVLLSEAVAQLDADYNADGAVDEADYDVWRGAYGSGLAAADGNGDGLVDAADYTLWRDQFGARLFTLASAGAIPEPVTAAMALFAAFGWLSSPRHRG